MDMATKKRALAEKVPGDEWKGYVNWNPSKTDIAEIVARLGDKRFSVASVIDDLVEGGYSVSFAWDVTAGCMRMSVTGKREPSFNMGYSLSLRQKTTAKLVAMAERYVFGICEGASWLTEVDGSEEW